MLPMHQLFQKYDPNVNAKANQLYQYPDVYNFQQPILQYFQAPITAVFLLHNPIRWG